MLEFFRRNRVRQFPVQAVSIPRSGHHFLVRMLRAAEPELRYCEFYSDAMDGCCHSNPCLRDNHLVKSHDFEMTDRKSREFRYLIQVRDIIPTLVSQYERDVREGYLKDSAEDFRTFAIATLTSHRIPFVKKWLSCRPRNSIVVHYDDLTGCPQETAREILDWFLFDVEVPELEPVLSKRRISEFRYYDRRVFDEITRLASEADRLISTFRKY